MDHILSITASTVDRWAQEQTRRASGELPRLIRGLVLATSDGVTQVDFPADDEVVRRGWDGITCVAHGNAWVPDGQAFWEVTCEHPTSNTKALKDYRKGTDRENAGVRQSAAYVFVTARTWRGVSRWQQQRQQQNEWLRVRILDAEEIATWLQDERATAMALWFGERWGLPLDGARSLLEWWDRWSAATTPAVSPELVLARSVAWWDRVSDATTPAVSTERDQAQPRDWTDRLTEWLQAPSGSLHVAGDSREQATAFVAAMLQRLPPGVREPWLSRAVVVETEQAWRYLTARHEGLLLVQAFDGAEYAPTCGDHRVLVPQTGPVRRTSRQSNGAVLSLSKLAAEESRVALQGMGVSFSQAIHLLGQSRRRLHALRWLLGPGPVGTASAWHTCEVGVALSPLLLVQSWDSANPADVEVVERLTGKPYQVVREQLIQLWRQPLSPLERVGSVWRWLAPMALWPLLGPNIDHDVSERWREVAALVLGRPDPALDLPAGERHMASLLGRTLPWSAGLRPGLAQGVALLAVCSEDVPRAGGRSGQDRAFLIVNDVLRAHADTWHSLAPLLPDLAEAAPRVFLDVLQQALDASPDAISAMLAETGFMGVPLKSGLLHALEILAWSPEHLTDSALALGHLSALSIGQSTDSAGDSLRGIFLSWYPATSADVRQRLAALDALFEAHPEVGWSLLCSLPPHLHDAAMPTARPTWREWAGEEERRITVAEFHEYLDAIVDRLATGAGADGERWRALVKRLPDLPGEHRGRFLTALEGLDAGAFGDEHLAALCGLLRPMINQHRRFPEQDWAMPMADVDRLAALLGRLQPRDLVVRHAWLFGFSYDLPELATEGWETVAERKRNRQREAALEVWSAGGFEAVLELAARAELPGDVGAALARADALPAEELDRLLACMTSADRGEWLFASGYFAAKGADWAKSAVAERRDDLSSEQLAAIFATLPFEQPTWDWIDGFGQEAADTYWREVGFRPPGGDREAAQVAARRLLAANRPWSAMACLSGAAVHDTTGFDAELLFAVLERAGRGAPEDERPPERDTDLPYDIATLFVALDQAQDVDATRLAALEYAYLPLLVHSERGPARLHKLLATDPAFFAQVVGSVYRPESQRPEDQEVDETALARARTSRELLHSWRDVPGRAEDGTVDPDALLTWVSAARTALFEADRATTGDLTIGEVLARVPALPGSKVPHEAVCKVLEQVGSREVETGYLTGVINGLGVVLLETGKGGEQWRRMQQEYERAAAQVEVAWPRAASALRNVAEHYKRSAERMDDDEQLS